VQDDGKGFRTGKTPEESKKNRGWGLKLIRELVDDVEIITGPDGTVVRMMIHLGGDSANPGTNQKDEGGSASPGER
jgi:anti-sigma regulatory factor (Ser/Thr protein kinase)